MRTCCEFVGTMAARIRFNATTRVERKGVSYWAKERFAWSAALVTAANAYARAVGLPMRMLHEADWLDYEHAVYRELLEDSRVLREGNRLLLPETAGVKLQEIMEASDVQTKQCALRWAVQSLARMHQQKVRHPLSGSAQSFSHADATPGNVVVDLQRRSATWLDFETVHPADMPHEERQADDLRTLLCGLAGLVREDEIPKVVETVVEAYQDERALAALWKLFQNWNQRPIARSLAIAVPSRERWKTLLKGAETR